MIVGSEFAEREIGGRTRFVTPGGVFEISLWLWVGPSVGFAIPKLELAVGRWTVEVDDKVSQTVRDWDRREEERRRWVDAPGRVVCWVLFACNVACDNKALASSEEDVDSPKDDICLPVSTPSLPPTFNNAPVVTEEPEVLARFTNCEESTDKELEADCFGPSNVSPFCVPSWDEPPSPPAIRDDNRNSKSGAGIRERAIVFDATRTRDFARKFFVAECVEPPLEVICGVSGWMVWNERICGESPHIRKKGISF